MRLISRSHYPCRASVRAQIPAFGLDLALHIDFGRLIGRGDAGINRGPTLFRNFGLLAEEERNIAE